MSLISAAEYVVEMRRLERIRNEALRHDDRSALCEIGLRLASLNRTFWGRDFRGF